MSPRQRFLRSNPDKQRRDTHLRGRRLTTLLALCGSFGCATYDPSLLPHNRPESSGGSVSALSKESAGSAGAELGGNAGDSGGSAGAPGASGAPYTAGSSGASTAAGGSAGTMGSGSASSAGASAAGGDAGSNANSGGTGGTGINPGSGGGGTGGVSGSGSAAATAIELARGKSAISSAEQGENPATSGNDGDLSTRWCAPTGDFPQWWRVDLGAAHDLKQVAIRFEYPDRTYVYTVESSLNDAVYTQQAAVSGTGIVQTVDLPGNVSARFVRITISNGLPAYQDGTATWASIFEVSVSGL